MSIYTTGQQLTIEEAKEYNRKISDWAGKQGSGCVGARACENCGTIVSGTCMCIGIFTCPKCGVKTEPEYLKHLKQLEISDEKLNIYGGVQRMG